MKPVERSEYEKPAIALQDIRFAWQANHSQLLINRLTVAQGERVFLQGPSGSGKSTLLGLIAGITTPQQGSVQILGEDLAAQSVRWRDRFRADHIGVIFQMFNLLPFLNVQDNVLLGTQFSASRKDKAIARSGSLIAETHRLLAALGLDPAELSQRRATELSVGQQQRVAAARALMGGPEIILADEPTSALDHVASENFLELLFAECTAADTALLFVSHDKTLSERFDRSIELGASEISAMA